MSGSLSSDVSARVVSFHVSVLGRQALANPNMYNSPSKRENNDNNNNPYKRDIPIHMCDGRIISL